MKTSSEIPVSSPAKMVWRTGHGRNHYVSANEGAISRSVATCHFWRNGRRDEFSSRPSSCAFGKPGRDLPSFARRERQEPYDRVHRGNSRGLGGDVVSKLRRYRALRRGKLLIVRAAAGSAEDNSIVLRLLIDTGSSHTVLPVEVLESLGCDTHHPLARVRILAANGTIVAPQVALAWFHCLGRRFNDFPVLAHTLPVGTYVDGLLGMDFLTRCRATISVSDGSITSHR